MKYFVALFLALPIVISPILLSSPSHAISSCNDPCQTLDDCVGQLICINERCQDDPDVGTHTCHLLSHDISSCNDPCRTLDDCAGQLICINERCHDDPDVGTHTCSNTPSPSDGGCGPSGTIHCHGTSFPTFRCSPPVTSSTQATLTNNDFSSGGASECDGRLHSNSELIVALSTGWYAGGSRCGDRIRITSSKTGSSVLAKVVDECDSTAGCDSEHVDDPPCGNNIVDGSNAVWHALGLDINVGEEDVTWSTA